jgi:hypothetical protein
MLAPKKYPSMMPWCTYCMTVATKTSSRNSCECRAFKMHQTAKLDAGCPGVVRLLSGPNNMMCLVLHMPCARRRTDGRWQKLVRQGQATRNNYWYTSRHNLTNTTSRLGLAMCSPPPASSRRGRLVHVRLRVCPSVAQLCDNRFIATERPRGLWERCLGPGSWADAWENEPCPTRLRHGCPSCQDSTPSSDCFTFELPGQDPRSCKLSFLHLIRRHLLRLPSSGSLCTCYQPVCCDHSDHDRTGKSFLKLI